jgi:hypothetical protein
MDTQLSFEYDMATLALKGKRYREAEEKFTKIALENQTAEAWCGMGLSKYGLIMEDVTVEEVFYCFNKAKIANPDAVPDLERLILESSLEVIRNLYGALALCQKQMASAKNQKIGAAISGVVGTMMTMEENNKGKVFGSIASAGITAASFTSYVQAGGTITEMRILNNKIKTIIAAISVTVKDFVTVETTRLAEFNAALMKREEREFQKTLPPKKFDEKEPIIIYPKHIEWFSAGCYIIAVGLFYFFFNGKEAAFIPAAAFCFFGYRIKSKYKQKEMQKEEIKKREEREAERKQAQLEKEVLTS